jgi:subtilase family serine protease
MRGRRITTVVAATAGSALLSLSMLSALSQTTSAAATTGQVGSATSGHRIGDAPASSTVDFSLVLNLRDAAGAAALVKSVSDPTSSSYRHYVTAKQWESQFSPSASQVNQAESWLKSEGFSVGTVPADRIIVPASGTAAQVEKAFGVGLGEYSAAGKTLREADSRVNVPASIASAVGGVMGINQIAAQPAALEPPPGAFITAPPCSTDFGGKSKTTTYGDQNPGYPDTMPDTVCGYVGSQLRSAYDIPASDTGAGYTVAIVDAYDLKTMASDATHYFNTSDPSAPFAAADYQSINQGPFDQQSVCGNWGDEQAIDVESAHSLAPDAHILYVGAQDCFDQGLFNAEQTIVDGHLADVISNSWGDDAGDLLTDAATKTAYDDLFQMADGTGIGVQFSSGDNGDNFDLVGFSSADYPTESPYVTSVGGTSLEFGANTSTSAVKSYGWSTGKSNKCEANVDQFLQGCSSSNFGTWLPAGADGSSGGFTSYNYTQPWYQNGIVPTSLSERNSAIDGPIPMRVDPDISLDADPATGFLIGLTEAFPDGSAKYGTTRYGGTSLASPILAGIVADVDQAGGVAAGFLNPTVYHLSQTTHTAVANVPVAQYQVQFRNDYVSQLFGQGTGLDHSVRIIGASLEEEYCDGTGNCVSRPDTQSAGPGYTSLTGLGTLGPNFVKDVAAAS